MVKAILPIVGSLLSLQSMFFILKIIEAGTVASWSWAAVMTPFWLAMGIVAVLGVLALLGAAGEARDARSMKKERERLREAGLCVYCGGVKGSCYMCTDPSDA